MRGLKKAYDPLATHAKLIPESDREEMLTFLQNGPASCSPPEWFKFLNRSPVASDIESPRPTQSDTTTGNDGRQDNDIFMGMFDDVFGTTATVVSDHNTRYQPIGMARATASVTAAARATAGKTCRCGSIHHLRTNHRRCPLNPRNHKPQLTTSDSSTSPPSKRIRRTTQTSQSHHSLDTDTDSDDGGLDVCGRGRGRGGWWSWCA